MDHHHRTFRCPRSDYKHRGAFPPMSSQPSQGSDSERHFSCEYCQRSFRRLEHLQRHTRRHTNERPFTCRCGESYARRDLLRRHERISGHTNPNNTPVRISVNDEQLIQSRSKPSSEAFQDTPPTTTHFTEHHISSPCQTLYSSGSATPSFRIPSGLEDYFASSIPGQTPRQTRHNESVPLASHEQGHSFAGFPTIFPYPRSSLATQVVPHFTTPKVTMTDRSRLLASLGRVEELSLQPTLPSTNALTRYMAGYFTGFYPHVPFTHRPTFRIESSPPELCLAMMALGAMDRFEIASANELFYLAKALLFDTDRHKAQNKTNVIFNATDAESTKQSIDDMRCLLCLAYFASWQNKPDFRKEASILHSLLGQSLRSSELKETAQTLHCLDWEQWSQQEVDRRTKLFAFCFLGIESIAYDTPPSIWCDEIDLRLPCSCMEWTAPDKTTWDMLRTNTSTEQGRFNDILKKLQAPNNQVDGKFATPSPVGNYVLLHGLVHTVIWTRRSISATLTPSISKEFQYNLESALQRWTLMWQRTPESNLEPLDPNGPLPFTSGALLSLAYVRNYFNVFQARRLSTWTPTEIARHLNDSFTVYRDRTSLLAAYHATNLLSTMVDLGAQYLRHNQAVLWSIEAALCGLECSVFLEKWLRRVQETMHDEPLLGHEVSLLSWIQDAVHEGLSSLNDSSFAKDSRQVISPEQIITVWSYIMQGNSPLPFIKMIGEVLSIYESLSARRLPNVQKYAETFS